MAPGTQRLAQWDGLRALAVGGVAMYHFLGRFGPWMPYAFPLQGWVRLGHLGVSLFFILSGFVIAGSLSASRGARDFAVRRVLRLMPAMLVCSLLTFIVMHALDTPFTRGRRVGLSAFMPSLTFSDPALWKGILPGAEYVDGAYWSLFVEVRFYAWAALIAAVSGRAAFMRVFGLASCAILALSALSKLMGALALVEVLQWLYFPRYLPLFCIGLALSSWKTVGARREALGFLAIFSGLALLQAQRESWAEAMATLALIAMPARLAFRPQSMPWLGNRALVEIGLCSYPIYLLHQNLGVAVISALPRGMGGWVYAGLVSGIVLAILALARSIHLGVERPIQRWANRRQVLRPAPVIDISGLPVPSSRGP